MTTKPYKVELDPNNRQRTMLMKHAGCARFAYNWGLAEWKRLYEAGEKTDPIKLHKALNALKKAEFPWMYEVSKCAAQEALRDLGTAFKNFFQGRSKYPRFKSKHRSRKSFRLTSPSPMKATRKTIKLPVIGTIRLKEKDRLPVDQEIKQVTVSERAGKWFVTAKVEVEMEIQPVETTGERMGIDLGVKTLATCSDGSTYENGKHLNKSLKKLQGLSKKLARQKKGSNKRAKTKACIAKVHARVSDQRSDAVHKMTTEVVRTKRPEVIVLEDLNVRGMVKNRKLAQAVHDAAMSEARRQFEYKTRWYGVGMIIADRFFPSTKMCSCCGALRKMELDDRVYECDACGTAMDRDLNAALNLAKVPSASSAGYARGEDVRPTRRQTSVKREPDRRLVAS